MILCERKFLMRAKFCSQMLMVVVGVCVSSMKIACGQAGPGSGYAKRPKGAYSIIAEVRAKPGKREDLRAATLPLISLVRSDPKNLVYFFQGERESPGHVIFDEVFETKEDFEGHNKMPYAKEWLAK